MIRTGKKGLDQFGSEVPIWKCPSCGSHERAVAPGHQIGGVVCLQGQIDDLRATVDALVEYVTKGTGEL